jgi:pimeloyl-ACP methyl ester carboxylesterase
MTEIRRHSVTSPDGTPIAYQSLGNGEGLVLIGGSLRAADDYLPLANALGRGFEVHVVDRRGRGASGPLGQDYAVEKECDDLLAVCEATGATRVFGHSYGGLVALETAKRAPTLTNLALYEPGLSLGPSRPADWGPRYEQLLAAGDTRGAFALFVKQAGHAPAFLTKLPLPYARALLRLAIRQPAWQRMEPLLSANLAEHRQLAALEGMLGSYAGIAADVLLMAGSASPGFAVEPLRELERILGHSELVMLDGLAHNAPDEQAPARVAECVLDRSRR